MVYAQQLWRLNSTRQIKPNSANIDEPSADTFHSARWLYGDARQQKDRMSPGPWSVPAGVSAFGILNHTCMARESFQQHGDSRKEEYKCWLLVRKREFDGVFFRVLRERQIKAMQTPGYFNHGLSTSLPLVNILSTTCHLPFDTSFMFLIWNLKGSRTFEVGSWIHCHI